MNEWKVKEKAGELIVKNEKGEVVERISRENVKQVKTDAKGGIKEIFFWDPRFPRAFWIYDVDLGRIIPDFVNPIDSPIQR